MALGGAVALALSLCPVRAAAGGPRPPLEVHQGRYFRWAAPAGWRATESANGVDLASPDGAEAAGFALLLRSRGSIAPADFVATMLARVPGWSSVRVLASRALPDQPSGIPGAAWKVAEVDVGFTLRGASMRGRYTCGIAAAYGFYDATLTGYYATAARWPSASLVLPAIARSVTITNPRQVAGNDQLIPARNRPLDDSGLMESWRQRGLSQDRISKARREGTMGYERVKDRQTGRVYEMPLEAYDGTVGGYRNPQRPTEILDRTQPGE
jgi:hypothetical protein